VAARGGLKFKEIFARHPKKRKNLLKSYQNGIFSPKFNQNYKKLAQKWEKLIKSGKFCGFKLLSLEK
jgi:hypothetical protein